MPPISLGKYTNNGAMIGPREMLDSALEDIGEEDQGAFHQGKKAIVIMLDDSDDKYSVSWRQAGMKMSEMLALLEIAKDIAKDKMGY